MLAELDYRRKATKEHIIGILSEQWPLNTKRIYALVRQRLRKPLTYQAVHLSMKEFVEQGIVVREGRDYLLSPEWIERMAARFNSLVERYTVAQKISSAKEFQELNFQSLQQASEFLLLKANSGFFGSSDVCYVQVARLFPIPPSQQQREGIARFVKSTRTVLLCRGSSVIDRIAANYLRKLGVDVRLGVAAAVPTNTVLIGNSVVTVYVLYSKERGRRVNAFYHSIRDILKQDVFVTFAELLSSGIKVKLAINRNPEVYANVREITEKIMQGSAQTV